MQSKLAFLQKQHALFKEKSPSQPRALADLLGFGTQVRLRRKTSVGRQRKGKRGMGRSNDG